MTTFNTSIGSANLPDVGTISYNGATFHSLIETKVSSNPVMDASNRTVKWCDVTITVDGTATLNDQLKDTTTDREIQILRRKIEVSGGPLVYTGKGWGNDFSVNTPKGFNDLNWGPTPKILQFIPLGASRSAKVVWSITTSIPEIGSHNNPNPVVQFNQESRVSYDSEGYTTITISGTLEIPLTWGPNRGRIPITTVDANVFRQVFMTKIASTFDLTRFKVSGRVFPVSRDCKTMEFAFTLQEQKWMGNPMGVMTAKGSLNVRPEKIGPSMAKWVAHLHATYNVPKTFSPRLAFYAFLSMWNFRMRQGQMAALAVNQSTKFVTPDPTYPAAMAKILGQKVPIAVNGGIASNFQSAQVIPQSFTIDEGLYEDSGQITFDASWVVLSDLAHILAATGIWRHTSVEDHDAWATSVNNISGWKSWNINNVDKNSLAVVDFGA